MSTLSATYLWYDPPFDVTLWILSPLAGHIGWFQQKTSAVEMEAQQFLKQSMRVCSWVQRRNSKCAYHNLPQELC